MAANKVLVDNRNKAIFTCPKCGETHTMDVSQFKDIDTPVRVRYGCPCGHSFSVHLERRQYFRKETALSGIYIFGPDKLKGLITVKDLSRTGLKFELKSKQCNFKVGDQIYLEFQLNDSKKTMIKNEARVKKISGQMVGAQFLTKLKFLPLDAV